MDEGPENHTERSVLLASMSEADRQEFLKLGGRTTFAPRETIFSSADHGNTLLVIESGRVEISITSSGGRKSVLNHMGPGEVLGEIALLDGGMRSADVTASGDVVARVIHRSAVMDFLRARPDAMLGLIEELCGKIRNASEMFEVQSQLEAPSRLARCILRLADKWGEEDTTGSISLRESFSQTDLGDFAGLTRESVNRHLKKWEAAGILTNRAGTITIRDQDALEDLAQS